MGSGGPRNTRMGESKIESDEVCEVTFRPVRYVITSDLRGAFVEPQHAFHVHNRRVDRHPKEEIPDRPADKHEVAEGEVSG